MTQRARAKLSCVAICAASALLCALNRAPMLAGLQGLAAIVIWRARFGQSLGANDTDALMVKLRDARSGEQARTAMIRATVMPNVIAVPSSAKRWRQTAIAFRDEMTTDRWRQVATALRHQSRPAASSSLTTKISRTRFAKLGDL